MSINKSLTVNRSNTLVLASYSLTLNEKRLIEIAIAKISTEKDIPNIINITADEYQSSFPDIKPNESYKELRKATDNLYEQSITLLAPEQKARAQFRWVDAVKYFDGEAKVELSFTQWVKPYLSQLKEGYTTYRLLDIGRLKSAHAIRLYELLMRYQDTGFRVDKLETLKELFGVADKYPRFADFNRWVIKPSVENINESSNWHIKPITIKKKGRKIDRIEFRFHLKDQPLLDL